MRISKFEVEGPFEIVPRKIEDERGYFSEIFRINHFSARAGDDQIRPGQPVAERHDRHDPGISLPVETGGARKVGALSRRSRSSTWPSICGRTRQRSGNGSRSYCRPEQNNQLWVPVGFRARLLHAGAELRHQLPRDRAITARSTRRASPGTIPTSPSTGGGRRPETLSEKDRAQPPLADLPSYFAMRTVDARDRHRRRGLHRLGAGPASGAREGYEVVDVDALTYAGNLTSLAAVEGDPNYRFLHADICDRAAMSEAMPLRPDRVMHLAAESHVDRSIDGPANSSRPTSSALHAARGRARIGRASTADREGRIPLPSRVDRRGLRLSRRRRAIPRRTPYDPNSPYSAPRPSSDHLARAWHHTFGLPVVITNCSNNYGPYQFPEKLIPFTILNALAGERLPVYGHGLNVRDWLYVEDHAQALDLVAEQAGSGETYNVGGRNERRNIDVVRGSAGVLDELPPAIGPHERLIEFVTDRPGQTTLCHRCDEAANELGWRAQEKFETRNGKDRALVSRQ